MTEPSSINTAERYNRVIADLYSGVFSLSHKSISLRVSQESFFFCRMWYNNYDSPAKSNISGAVLARVEEILLEAPLHEHEVGEGPRGMRMEGRIVGARRAEQSVKLLQPHAFLRKIRMKSNNILIGILSALCVIIIAFIAFLTVRTVNIAESASQKKETHEAVREKEAAGKGSGLKEGGAEAKHESDVGNAAGISENESDAGKTADGSRENESSESKENQNTGSAAGETGTEAPGTDSPEGRGDKGEPGSAEYEIDGVLYMGDGRPVYEYLDPPADSVIDYCPFDVEEFVASAASVYRMAHDNGFEYGNSDTLPPCEDGFIACDRLIARALWDLGYTDQPQGGMQIISGGLTEEQYLTTHGFIKINDPSKLRRGDIVLQDDGKDGGPRYTWHTFILVDYDPVTQICSKYDCGHFTPEGVDRVSSEQPFVCPLADFGDQRRFVCAFRIRTEPQSAE